MDFIISHALRGLVKEGNQEALELLGYHYSPNIIVRNFQIKNKTVSVGESLVFSFEIEAKEDEALMVDYIIYFKTKVGKLSPKVHKLKKLSIQKGEKIGFEKKHLFRANMTTRTFYEGEHRLALQVNGQVQEEFVFELVVN